MTVLLLVAYAFAIVDRIIIGLLVDDIKTDLGVTDTQIGILQGFAFAILYTLAAIPVGVLVDRWNRVKLLSIGIGVWSVMTIVSGFARSFGGLFVSRIGVGLGEATVTPASSSLISDYFPPQKRQQAYGVFLVGGAIGAGMAYLLGGFAIAIGGPLQELFPTLLGGFSSWHITFILVGLPGLLIAPLLLFTVREPVRRERATAARKFSFDAILQQYRRHPIAYAAMYVGAILNIAIVYAQLGWVPTAFMRLYDWTPTQIAAVLSMVSVPCSVISALSAGWFLSWFLKRGRTDGPILVAAMQGGVWAIFGTLKFMMPTGELAMFFHAMTALTGSMGVAAALAGISQITPNELRGQFTAIYALLTGLVSVTAGSFIVGFLSDNLFPGSRGVGMSLSSVYFAFGVLAFAVLFIGRRDFQAATVHARQWVNKD